MTDFNPAKIKAIIGLGNPGDKYSNTYHNVGIQLIKAVTEDPSLKSDIKKSEKSLFTTWDIPHPVTHQKLTLATLNVLMNNSGNALKELLDYFNINPESVLVAHDDSDIAIGEYKLSFNRGSAGHKGIESIVNRLNSKKFWRARIGVRSENEGRKAENFVLNKISSDNKVKIDQAIRDIKNNLITRKAPDTES